MWARFILSQTGEGAHIHVNTHTGTHRHSLGHLTPCSYLCRMCRTSVREATFDYTPFSHPHIEFMTAHGRQPVFCAASVGTQKMVMWLLLRLCVGEVADEVRLVTRLYTPDACNTLRADSAARAQALETRLATLKEQHARGETDPGAHIQDLTSHIEMTGAQDTLLQRS